MLCFALQAGAILLLLAARDHAMLWAYVFVFGFSMGGVLVLLPLAVGHFFGLRAFGGILGALLPAQALGSALGAFFSGWVYDHWGGYDVALQTLLCVYLMAVATMFVAGDPRPDVATAGERGPRRGVTPRDRAP
jgi:MFS family permease